MKAVCYEKHGDVKKVLVIKDVQTCPPPSSSQLRVRVRAASINPADWKSSSGEQKLLIKFQWPRVVGFDFSGEVERVGVGVGVGIGVDDNDEENLKVGDLVFGMIAGLPQLHKGTMSELILVEKFCCARCPPPSSQLNTEKFDVHALCAGVPLVGITALKMFSACGLIASDKNDNRQKRVLITGGSGGVGTAAIQLAVNHFGVSKTNVFTTCSSLKSDLCGRLGAGNCVDYRKEKFEKTLATSSFDELFDLILDCTDEAGKCVGLLKPRVGVLCSILAGPTAVALRTWLAESKISDADITVGVKGFLMSDWGGRIFELVSGARALKKRCRERGGCEFKHVIGTGDGEMCEILGKLMATGLFVPCVDSLFEMVDAVEAFVYQMGGIKHGGKVVVRIN